MFRLRTEYNEAGFEVPDEMPIVVPGMRQPETLAETIKRMVRVEMGKVAASQGMETFEEADDFDIPDEDGEFVSPYEIVEMDEERPKTAQERLKLDEATPVAKAPEKPPTEAVDKPEGGA